MVDGSWAAFGFACLKMIFINLFVVLNIHIARDTAISFGLHVWIFFPPIEELAHLWCFFGYFKSTFTRSRRKL